MAEPFDLPGLLGRIPYARFLGITGELAGDEMTATMRYADHLIGNPALPALHGGVLGAFMELTAVAQLAVLQAADGQPVHRLPRPVDVNVEYLRSGRPRDTYARALVKKRGRRIATVYVDAWQDARANPIAALHGHFMLAPPPEPAGDAG